MKGKKIKSILLIAVFMISTLAVTYAVVPEGIYGWKQEEGDGTVEIVTEERFSLSRSAKLTLPADVIPEDEARVVFDYYDTLESLMTISYMTCLEDATWHEGDPAITFSVDKDDDGAPDYWVIFWYDPDLEYKNWVQLTFEEASSIAVSSTQTGLWEIAPSILFSELKALDDWGTYEVLQIKVGLGTWGQIPSGTDIIAYIDDVTINEGLLGAVTYDFEPTIAFDEDWYQIDDIVTVTFVDVYGMYDEDPDIQEILWPIEVTSTPTGEAPYRDTISIVLTETDVDTSIFTGTFKLVHATPDTGELVVSDGDEIEVKYKIFDEESVTDTAKVSVDELVPTIDIVNPEAFIKDDTPLIEADIADDESGLASAIMKLDGEPVAMKTYSGITTSDTISYTVPSFAPLDEGSHTVQVMVSDIAGNVATETMSFTVDLTKPTVSVKVSPDPAGPKIPVNGEIADAGIITFTLTFSEDMDEDTDTTVKFGKDSPYTTKTVECSEDWTELNVLTATFNLLEPAWIPSDDGLQTVSISGAKDLAGNTMAIDTSKTFTIDTIAPTVPVDLTATATDVSITLTWTASTDVGTEVESYEIHRSTTQGFPPGIIPDGDPEITSYVDEVTHPITTYTDYEPLDEDTYYYVVIAVDAASNKAESEEASVEFVPADVIAYPVELVEGWNLISLPLIPEDSDIEVVLADVLENVETVHHYDNEEEKFLNYVAAASEFATLADIEDGEGYWVKMTADDTLIVYGTEQPVADIPRVYDVYEGWNQIGFKSTTGKPVGTYLTTIPDTLTDCMVIYRWDATDQAYALVCAGEPTDENTFSPGEGYWLYLIGDAVIVPTD